MGRFQPAPWCWPAPGGVHAGHSIQDYRNTDKKGVMHFRDTPEDAAKFLVEGRGVSLGSIR